MAGPASTRRLAVLYHNLSQDWAVTAMSASKRGKHLSLGFDAVHIMCLSEILKKDDHAFSEIVVRGESCSELVRLSCTQEYIYFLPNSKVAVCCGVMHAWYCIFPLCLPGGHHPSVPSVRPSVCLYVCPSVCLSVRRSVGLSVGRSVCLSICLSVLLNLPGFCSLTELPAVVTAACNGQNGMHTASICVNSS